MPKRILQGTVISDGNDKTIVVNVDRRVRHPLYKRLLHVLVNFMRMMKVMFVKLVTR